MIPPPWLSPVERLAVWLLHRSPRVGLLIVKRIDWPQVAYSVARRDAEATEMFRRARVVRPAEPPSMTLERLYHLPSYGENE